MANITVTPIASEDKAAPANPMQGQNMPVQQQQPPQAPAQPKPKLSKNFDPAVVKHSYNSAEWDAKEAWYIKSLSNLEFKSQETPTPAELSNMLIRFDTLFTIASMEASNMKKNANYYKNLVDLEEKKDFNIVKASLIQSGSKATVDEVKSAYTTMIAKNQWKNTGKSLYEIAMETDARKVFMEGVIDVLKTKKDTYMLHSSCIKSMSALEPMTPNAPNV